jgi:hypothetical protein
VPRPEDQGSRPSSRARAWRASLVCGTIGVCALAALSAPSAGAKGHHPSGHDYPILSDCETQTLSTGFAANLDAFGFTSSSSTSYDRSENDDKTFADNLDETIGLGFKQGTSLLVKKVDVSATEALQLDLGQKWEFPTHAEEVAFSGQAYKWSAYHLLDAVPLLGPLITYTHNVKLPPPSEQTYGGGVKVDLSGSLADVADTELSLGGLVTTTIAYNEDRSIRHYDVGFDLTGELEQTIEAERLKNLFPALEKKIPIPFFIGGAGGGLSSDTHAYVEIGPDKKPRDLVIDEKMEGKLVLSAPKPTVGKDFGFDYKIEPDVNASTEIEADLPLDDPALLQLASDALAPNLSVAYRRVADYQLLQALIAKGAFTVRVYGGIGIDAGISVDEKVPIPEMPLIGLATGAGFEAKGGYEHVLGAFQVVAGQPHFAVWSACSDAMKKGVGAFGNQDAVAYRNQVEGLCAQTPSLPENALKAVESLPKLFRSQPRALSDVFTAAAARYGRLEGDIRAVPDRSPEERKLVEPMVFNEMDAMNHDLDKVGGDLTSLTQGSSALSQAQETLQAADIAHTARDLYDTTNKLSATFAAADLPICSLQFRTIG